MLEKIILPYNLISELVGSLKTISELMRHYVFADIDKAENVLRKYDINKDDIKDLKRLFKDLEDTTISSLKNKVLIHKKHKKELDEYWYIVRYEFKLGYAVFCIYRPDDEKDSEGGKR